MVSFCPTCHAKGLEIKTMQGPVTHMCGNENCPNGSGWAEAEGWMPDPLPATKPKTDYVPGDDDQFSTTMTAEDVSEVTRDHMLGLWKGIKTLEQHHGGLVCTVCWRTVKGLKDILASLLCECPIDQVDGPTCSYHEETR